MSPPRAFSLWLFLVLLDRLPRASGAKQPGIAQKIREWKFSTSDRKRCTWSAGEAGDVVKVRINCETPGAQITETSCEYFGRPRSCLGYTSDPTAFWKQVARAFKKLQGKVCADRRALVKAGMCKRAPRVAHLRLDPKSVKKSTTGPTTPLPLHPTTTECVKRADHRRTAEEYCSSSWASVCSFFMFMLQSEDC